EFDAVVVIGVVRGTDHHTGHEPQGAGQIRHRRCWHGPRQQHVNTGRGEPCFERRFQHVAGNAGVLSDHHGGATPPLMIAGQHPPGRMAQPQRELGVDRGPTYPTADPVGTKILTFAHTKDSSFIVRHIFTASTVSATSCTRRMWPPISSPYSAAARLAASRSPGSLPTTWPSMDLREKPSSQG